jgi:mRNA (guanine-N7-)-methyltransferase
VGSALKDNTFVSLAADYGLYPTYKEEFHQIFAENGEVPEFSQLLQRMKVVDVNGESSMDEDQWEAASESTCTFAPYSVLKLNRYLYRIRL